MNPVADNAVNQRWKYLEIEFSETICRALPQFVSFSRKKKIEIDLFLEEAAPALTKLLLDFCRELQKEEIPCKVILPFALLESRKLLFRENIRQKVRICREMDLQAFLTEKEQFPGTELELIYDRSRQPFWNLAEAMDLCRKNGIHCSFGCSDSYIEAGEEELKAICGGEKLTPFPNGENCMRFADSLFFAHDGTFYPCRGLKALPVGNIFSETWEETVENSTILNFYGNYRQKIKAPCKKCPQFQQCAGCRGRAFLFSSDFLSADPACSRNLALKSSIVKLPVRDPENYLPHQKPMLMISELTAIRDNICEAVSVIGKDNPFLLSCGKLHSASFIEIGAQSMAFLDAFLHPDSRLQGMLVEVSKFTYSGIPVYAGMRLLVRGEKVYEMPPWNIGAFTIRTDQGELVAEGEVKVCQFRES